MELALPDTLIVRRLPETLTEADLNELFLHFGAQSAVRQYFRGNKRRSNVLVKFPTQEDASLALIRLHQQIVMGKRLVVEYANFSFLPPPKISSIAGDNTVKDLRGYIPADEAIVENVASLLLTNEEFYLRVLQLIKVMGLKAPCSKEQSLKTPLHTTSEIISETPIEEVEMEELYKEDTEESELESDGDVIIQKADVPELPKRCKKLKLKRLDRLKAVKLTESVLKASSKKEKITNISEVFEKPNLKSGRQFNVKITTDVTKTEPLSEATTEPIQGFGHFNISVAGDKNMSQVNGTPNSVPTTSDFVTEQTLHANRLSNEEKSNLSVFKNYSPGVPNLRLYIKNIAKTVKDEDLKFVYGRYVNWESEEERNMFDIRLMTEGRMKGQAFITLPNVQQAVKAVSETNGYVLQGKPFVVQFARAAVAKANTNTT